MPKLCAKSAVRLACALLPALLAGQVFTISALAQMAVPANAPVARLPHVLVNPERIARRVFDMKTGGQNVGTYLIRMPGGMIFLRGEASGGEIVREFFRFGIQIKVAEREKWRQEARTRKQEGRPAPIGNEAKPLSAFFNDDTLSAGDVVVAIEGFRVFRGSANFPWRASDFVPLDRWRRDAGGKRGLRALEAESRRTR